jgi:hypothetical protein
VLRWSMGIGGVFLTVYYGRVRVGSSVLGEVHVIGIDKSSRHTSIVGHFGEYLVCN